MKYNIHIYAVVRVKVVDVEAGSQEEAIKRVCDHVNLNDLLNRSYLLSKATGARPVDSPIYA